MNRLWVRWIVPAFVCALFGSGAGVLAQGLLQNSREAVESTRQKNDPAAQVRESSFAGAHAKSPTEAIAESEYDEQVFVATQSRTVVPKKGGAPQHVSPTADAELDQQKAETNLDYQVQVFSTFFIRTLMEQTPPEKQLPAGAP